MHGRDVYDRLCPNGEADLNNFFFIRKLNKCLINIIQKSSLVNFVLKKNKKNICRRTYGGPVINYLIIFVLYIIYLIPIL